MKNKTPKVLCLDDLNSRQKEIQRDFPGAEIIHCQDIWSAQEAIKTEKFDIIFLDYDLCDYSDASAIVSDDSQFDLTGADFLVYMFAEVPQENWPDKVVIISINKDGAKEMQWLLDSVGIENSWDPLPN